jgi:3-oxoadipate enol-lactonase
MSMSGTRPSPTVVLLHSLGTDGRLWRDQVGALEDAYRVLVPESRGHGVSPWRPGLTVQGWVDDLHCWLRDATDGPVHLVGLSMGGVQALAYAAAHPQMVRSLVLADTFARLDDEVARAKVDGVRADVRTLGMSAYADVYIDQTLLTPAGESRREDLRRAIAGMSPEAYVGSSEVCFGADLIDVLASVAVPALVMIGERDQKTPYPLSEALADGLADARLVVVEGAGHLSNVDAPQHFNRYLRTFLDAAQRAVPAVTTDQDRSSSGLS